MSDAESMFGIEDDDETLALKVAAGGALALVLGLIFGSRLLRLLGLVAALAGGGLYARGKLAERSEKIDAAETRIRSELDDLDPVARAQVIQGIVES
ncbi:MAG TPA: hypothetical protein VH950_13435 [Gaiellaceae bacterium]|jgi:hypothetical protein